MQEKLTVPHAQQRIDRLLLLLPPLLQLYLAAGDQGVFPTGQKQG